MSPVNQCSYTNEESSWECNARPPFYVDENGNHFCSIHSVEANQRNGATFNWQGTNLRTLQGRLQGELKENLIRQISGQNCKVYWFGYLAENLELSFDDHKFKNHHINLSNLEISKNLNLSPRSTKSFSLANFKAETVIFKDSDSLEEITLTDGKITNLKLNPDGNIAFSSNSLSLHNVSSKETVEIKLHGGRNDNSIKVDVLVENCSSDTLDIHPKGIVSKLTISDGAYGQVIVNESQGPGSVEASLIMEKGTRIKNRVHISSKGGFPNIEMSDLSVGSGEVSLSDKEITNGIVKLQNSTFSIFRNLSPRSFYASETKFDSLTFSNSLESCPSYALENIEIHKYLVFEKQHGQNAQQAFYSSQFTVKGGTIGSWDSKNYSFIGDMCFSEVIFKHVIKVRSCVFGDDFKITDSKVNHSDFSAAKFKQLCDISGTHFSAAPKFFKTEIGSNLRLSKKTKMLDHTGDAAEKYAQLRLLMSSAKQLDYSGFFHRQELRSISKKTWTQFIFFWLYEITSKCCQSIGRVVISFLALNTCFAAFYCKYASTCQKPNSLSDLISFDFDYTVVNFTLSQIFQPFSVWSGRGDHITLYLMAIDSADKSVFPLIASLQSISSAMLLALLFFSVRRKFKMPN